MKYRKSVVIDAVLWDGNPQTLHGLLADTAQQRPHRINELLITSPAGHITIRTLEGDEFYPCKPDIFAATYEPVA